MIVYLKIADTIIFKLIIPCPTLSFKSKTMEENIFYIKGLDGNKRNEYFTSK